MPTTRLKRELTHSHLLFISFSAIFGSGWLFTPLYAAQMAGPYALLAWALGAFMSVVIGMTMAEVIVLYPQTVGLSAISKKTHGEFLSLFITILNLLVFLVLPAIEVRAVLQYVFGFLSLSSQASSISGMEALLAFFLLSMITLVNLFGARLTGAVTQWIALFKLVTPVLICSSFLYKIGLHGAVNFTRLFVNSTADSGIPWSQVFQAIATGGIIFSFNGFNQATLFAGEARNPQKSIPFAIVGSILLSGLLYFFIQYAFLVSVPKESFAAGWSFLSFPGDQGPFAGIAVLLGLGSLLAIIYANAVISPLGTAFAYASAAPRLFYSLAQGGSSDEYSHKGFWKLNRYGVSTQAIVITLVLEFLIFVFLPSLKEMIALLVAAFIICYTVAPTSLLILRRAQPKLYRPFRVPVAPLFAFFSLFFSNLMIFFCGWIAIRNLMAFSVVFVLIDLFRHRTDLLGRLSHAFSGSMWFLVQLVCLGLFAYVDFCEPMAFSLSCFLIAGMSVVALLISQASAENQVI
jgi:amino acid transporter